MSIFHKKQEKPIPFDPEKEEPAIKKSICTGEATVGFVDRVTGHFRDIQVVSTPLDIAEFCRRTGTDPDKIKTIY